MNWLALGIFFSIFYILYSLQQMKIALKDNGYDVDLLSNPMEDHNNFKALIEKEEDPGKRAKYQSVLNGLYVALVGIGFILAYMFFGQGK
ncbi:MAG: hypothetical protein LJE94_01770 [Deltaproteobacteria bacterium]|jgi:hypothetical protein|nr:hypothetical protein [Deltaproteobacteria bacterium]